MRFTSSSNGLAAIAIISSTAIAFQPKHLALMKRQGCNNIDSQCNAIGSTLTDCVNYVCDSCTSIDAAIPKCCELSTNSDIADCIKHNVGTSGSSYGSSIGSYYGSDSYTGYDYPTTTGDYSDYSNSYTYTSSYAITTPYLYTANPECSSVISKIDACSSATPGFGESYLWDEQASCICYSGASYAPKSFDYPYSSCLDVLSSSDSSAYQYLTINSDDAASTPCASLSQAQETSYYDTSSAGDFTVIGANAAMSTNTPATLTPSPGSKPTVKTTPRSTTSSPSSTPTVVGNGAGNGAGNTAAGSGVHAFGVQVVFVGIASFVAVLYIL
ncbi:MAG: hypothetical protein Q9170_003755 [Blastenia crenularia]